MPEAARFVGAWQDSAALAALKRGELTELTGCDIVVVRAGSGRFEGDDRQRLPELPTRVPPTRFRSRR